MIVKQMLPGDEAEVLRFGHLFDDPPLEGAVREYLGDARNIFLLASEAGEGIGFLRGTALLQVSSPRKQMLLYEIGVALAHRRRGAGRALVQRLKEYCAGLEFDEIFVFTEPTNGAAVRLYETTGGKTETSGDRMYVYRLR